MDSRREPWSGWDAAGRNNALNRWLQTFFYWMVCIDVGILIGWAIRRIVIGGA